jgi:hypothetical protein
MRGWIWRERVNNILTLHFQMREISPKMSGLLIFLLGFQLVSAQTDCNTAPTANARRTCMSMRRMDQQARANANANTNEPEEVWPPSLPVGFIAFFVTNFLF